jgi:hypothetical protein
MKQGIFTENFDDFTHSANGRMIEFAAGTESQSRDYKACFDTEQQ